MAGPDLDPQEFGASFKSLLDQVVAQAPEREAEIRKRIRLHVGAEPDRLPVVAETFAPHERPNLHLALEALLAAPGTESDSFGVSTPYGDHGLSLAALLSSGAGARHGPEPSIGPVRYVNVPLDEGRVLACVKSGLFLVRRRDERVVVLVHGTDRGFRDMLQVEVMASDRSAAERLLAELRIAMRERNVYRGRAISLALGCDGTPELQFHRFASVQRDEIVLPDGLLDAIELHTVRFGELRDRMRAMGRHLKRGILLHGPPGTGKTLTAMYLAGRMPDRTVVVLTGRGHSTIEPSCRLARLLAPSTVVIEDVDLVAEERTHSDAGRTSLLFELLNQMDGLAEDADVLFVLTTNRPDLLEPALAARPGRIDQAIEVPLPDATCRRRLIDRYARGLVLQLAERESFVERTAGVSAAFLRELLRKAALHAADAGPNPVVTDAHMNAALKELLVDGGELTKSLLGAARSPTPRA